MIKEQSSDNNSKSNELDIGNQFIQNPGNWEFNEGIVDDFDDHIYRSIPRYKDCHNLGVIVSDFFLNDGSKIYDLGSTSGAFIEKLCLYHKGKKNLNVNCVEIMSNFCKFSEARFKKLELNKFHSIAVINDDIRNIAFEEKSIDFITSFFTLQFIKPSLRFEILSTIYRSLNWGGGFIFFEKVRGADARFQDILNYLLNMEKLEREFTHHEILAKSLALVGKMEPFSDFGNREILHQAGFRDIEVIFKHINFQGYLCIK